MDKRPDIAYIRKYVNGELSPREMFDIEKAAHEDEVLMDIIWGLEAEKETAAPVEAVPELLGKIKRRSEHADEQQRTNVFPWKIVAIAASLLLVVGISVTFWYNRVDVAEYSLAVESPVVQEDFRSDNIDEQVTESVAEEELSAPQPNPVGIPRKKEKKTLAHVPDIIEIELPQPRYDRDRNIPFGKTSLDPDSSLVLASAPNGRSKIVGDVIASNRAGAEQSVMIRGVGALKRSEGSSNITNIPVDEIKSITTGIVVDQQTQQPIVGALIKDLKTKNAVNTDSTGRFVIASTQEKTNLQVDYIGFERAMLAANGSMRIELYPAEATLEEVVVNGYGKSARKTKSEPVDGTKAYRKYIDNATKDAHLKRGTVILIFEVDGSGRPVNIRVKQSAGAAHDQQAIRIVKSGPDWIRGDDGEDVEWKVSF